MPRLAQGSRDYVTKIAPPKYHHLIIPTYRTFSPPYDHLTGVNTFPALGCKRIVRDQGYLQSLSRPNVRLTFDRITHVERDGVMTETGLCLSLTGRQSFTYLTFTRRIGRP